MEWIVFRLKGEVVQKVSVSGYMAGEVQATRELLAYEHGVDVAEITVDFEEE